MSGYLIIKILANLLIAGVGLYATWRDFSPGTDATEAYPHRPSALRRAALTAMLAFGILLSIALDVTKELRESREKADDATRALQRHSEQMSVVNQLVERLTDAQRTTQTISAGMQGALTTLSNQTAAIGSVLGKAERALEPLGTLAFNCALRLPSTDPEVTRIIHGIKEAVRRDPGAFHLDDQGLYTLVGPPKLGGYIVRPDTPLYPKSNSTLGQLLKTVILEVQFRRKHIQPSKTSIGELSIPDLRMDISTYNQRPTLLMVTPDDNALVFEMTGEVPFGQWGSNGTILSVRDLVHAQAVVQPRLSLPVEAQSSPDHPAAIMRRNMTIHKLIMYTGDGRRWKFETKPDHILTVQGVPIFVGRFVGPMRTSG